MDVRAAYSSIADFEKKSLQQQERQEPTLSEVEGIGQPVSFKIGKAVPAPYCAKLLHANNERCIFHHAQNEV
jgi:hypothetical protein